MQALQIPESMDILQFLFDPELQPIQNLLQPWTPSDFKAEKYQMFPVTTSMKPERVKGVPSLHFCLDTTLNWEFT